MTTAGSQGRKVNSLVALLLILAGTALCITIVLAVLGRGGGAVATGIFCVILLAAAGIDATMSQRKLASHGGDPRAVESDAEDSTPGIVQSEEEPLGVSSDVHDDLNPHDLPIDHPARTGRR